jgi:hypothetical protein
MEAMHRLRTLAAVLACVALVAALPAPCGCAPQEPGHPDAHACCVPPTGVSEADQGCCDEAPAALEAVPAPAGADPVVAVAAALPVPPAALGRPVATRSTAFLAPSPPPAVLRI